jgi:hypothetical protein
MFFIPIEFIPYQEGDEDIYLGSDENSSTELFFQSGWNMVGLPLEVADGSVDSVFPDAIDGTLYSYDGTYSEQNTLENGRGYWLRFGNSGNAEITGAEILSLTLNLSEGWNLISGISSTIEMGNIIDPSNIIIDGTLYGYNSSYVSSYNLAPGAGYWLRANANGEVTFGSGVSSKTQEADFQPRNQVNSFTINGTEFYFGMEHFDGVNLSYSLPPKPPSGAFDIRFSGDSRLCFEDECVIEVMNDGQPLVIYFEFIDDESWEIVDQSGNVFKCSNVQELELSGETVQWILRKSTSIVPSIFTIHSAYPNPFNPITTLRYDLPDDNHVTLTIYDLNGREINRLVNTVQSAGHKTIQWNATDMNGKPVSAGIYLYQIQSGEFIQTRKMVLLK